MATVRPVTHDPAELIPVDVTPPADTELTTPRGMRPPPPRTLPRMG